MFAAGYQVTSNAAEDVGAFQRSKAAGYLLLHFSHPEIVFGQVIRKGY